MKTLSATSRRNQSHRFYKWLPIMIGLLAATSFAQDSVQTLTVTRPPVAGSPPVMQSFIVTTPVPGISVTTTAVLILLPGGDGNIQLTPVGSSDGTLTINSNNFLVRSRWLFAAQGFHVLTLDSATDFQLLPGGLTGQQGNTSHITDVLQVIAYARSTYPGLPVWLVGTSRGTAGAFVAGLYNPPAGGPDGVVFTSPINVTGDPDSLLSAPLATITVPTQIVGDTADTCPVTLPSGNPAVKKLLTGTPVKAVATISGGATFMPLTTNCNGLSPHGFFGIEPATVQKIATWVNAH